MWTDPRHPSTRILFAVINNRGPAGSSIAPLGAPYSHPEAPFADHP